MIGSSNDKTNFPQKLLLTNTEVSKNHKAFANGSSANIKLSKTQLSKMIQSGGFLEIKHYLIALVKTLLLVPQYIDKKNLKWFEK